MADKADIELLFGVLGGGSPSGKSAVKIRNQLNNIIGNINKKPLEIKVTVSDKSISKIKSQLDDVVKEVNKGGTLRPNNGRKISSSGKDSTIKVGSDTSEVQSAESDVKRLVRGTEAYNKALTTISNKLTKFRENGVAIWTDAAEGASKDAYNSLMRQVEALERLEEAVRSGQMPVKEFNTQLAEIVLNATKAAEAIDAVGENRDSSRDHIKAKAESFREAEKAIKEYYKAQTDAAKYGSAITQGTDGTWFSANEHLSALVERLNKTKQAYDAVQASIESLPLDKQQDLTDQIATAQGRLNEAIQKYAAAMEGADVKAYRDQMSKVDNLLIKTKKNLENLSAAKTGKSSKSYQGLEETVVILEEMRKELKEGGVALVGFDEKFDRLSSSVRGFNADIELAGENVKSVKTRLSDLAKTLGVSFSIADAFHKAIEIGKQMIDTVTEIDTAMTELKKVTDETDATYDRFLENAEPRARALGATVADVVSATADFSKLGHTISEASDLADTAIVYKNVADGIDDISEASESIVSTMQAFKIEAENAMTIVDLFNEVSNRHSVTSEGLGQALQRSAAALAAGGNTLAESIALITSSNKIVQNPESVGKNVCPAA